MHPLTNFRLSGQAWQHTEDVSEALRTPGMVEVTATEEATLGLALGNAIAVVSRIGSDRYIVRAHPAVPYGMVRHSYL